MFMKRKLLLIGLSLFAAGTFMPDAQAACPGATQTDMNACAASDYARADKELNGAWGKLPKSEPLVATQRAWIAFRDAECAYRAAQFEGGSIAPLIRSSCMAELTRQRTQMLIDAGKM
jgi:uncharacterized protein YecT (DUF1311 family)